MTALQALTERASAGTGFGPFYAPGEAAKLVAAARGLRIVMPVSRPALNPWPVPLRLSKRDALAELERAACVRVGLAGKTLRLDPVAAPRSLRDVAAILCRAASD